MIISLWPYCFIDVWTHLSQGYCNFLPEEKLLQAVEIGQVVYISMLLILPLHGYKFDVSFYLRANVVVLVSLFCIHVDSLYFVDNACLAITFVLLFILINTSTFQRHIGDVLLMCLVFCRVCWYTLFEFVLFFFLFFSFSFNIFVLVMSWNFCSFVS